MRKEGSGVSLGGSSLRTIGLVAVVEHQTFFIV